MAIKFFDSDGFGNPGPSDLSLETHIALEFTTDSATYTDYGDNAHRTFTQSKRPHKFSRYYRNGPEVPDAPVNSKISQSGELKFSSFYGATNVIYVRFFELNSGSNYYENSSGGSTTYSKSTELNLYNVASTFVTPVAGTITTPFHFVFDTDVVFNNSVVMGGDFNLLTIENDGIIAGRGGDGAGSNKATPDLGNSALILNGDATLVKIENTTNGIIAGGGNGGARDNSASGSAARQATSENHRPRVEWSIIKGGGGGWNGGIGGRTYVYGRAFVIDQDDGDALLAEDFDDAFQDGNATRTVVLNRSGGAGNTNTTIADTQQQEAGSFSVSDASLTTPVPGTAAGGTWGGRQGTGAKTHMFSAFPQFNGARIRVRGASASNGGATLPPDTDGLATGPGGGNSVEKTGSISTLTYIGSTAQYYGTRDT